MASAPASRIRLACPTQPPGVMPLRLAITGTDSARLAWVMWSR
jgi:hypothetical protein